MNSFLSFIITLVILSLLRKWKMILPLWLELYFLRFTVRKWFGKKKKAKTKTLLLEISKEPEERTWPFSSNDGHCASLCHLFKARVISSVQFSSVQLLSHVQLFVTPWITAHKASLSITNSWNLPKLMSVESVMPSNHLILCHPFLLLPSIFPSIKVFSNDLSVANYNLYKWLMVIYN